MPIEIPYVQKRMLTPTDIEENVTEAKRPYYIINLAKIPRAVFIGLKEDDYFPPSIPWANFADWLAGEKSRSWNPEHVNHRRIQRVSSLLLREPLNHRYRTQLWPGFSPHPHIPTHVPLDEEYAGEEIVIAIDAASSELAQFEKWYERTLRAVKKAVLDEQTADLRRTLGDKLDYLKKKIDANEKKVGAPLEKVLQKLLAGEQIFQIMFDFAEPAAKREKMWSSKYAHLDYVVPPPSKKRRRNAGDRRLYWADELTRRCARILAHSRSSGPIDDAASGVLFELRDPDSPAYRMLKDWDKLCPAARSELAETMLTALRLALRSKRTAKALAKTEFVTIAIATGGAGGAIGPKWSDSNEPRQRARSKILAETIASVDVAQLLPNPEETPLGKWAGEKLQSAAGGLENGGLALDILALATPYISASLKTYHLSGAVDSAWLWRSLVGSAKLNEAAQRQVWAQLGTLVWEGHLPTWKGKPVELLDVENGALKEVLDGGAPLWKIVNVIGSALVLAEGAHRCKEESLEVALEQFSNMMSLSKDLADLVVSMSTHRLFFNATEAELAKYAKEFGGPAIPILNIIADSAALAVSIQQAHGSQRKWSKKERERTIQNAMLDGVSLAITIASLVVGAEFAILGLVLYGVKAAIDDPDLWMPYLPMSGIGRKPGPHYYLEGLLKSIDEDDELRGAIEALESQDGKELRSRLADELGLYELPIDDSAPETERAHWDIGGAPGKHIDYNARKIVRDSYRCSKEVALAIVIACAELESVGRA